MSFLAGSLLWQAFTGGNVLTRVGTALAHDAEAAWGWLSRDFWRLAFVVALILAGYFWLNLKAEQRHAAKVEAQLKSATDTLNQLRSESKQQQKQVTKVVDHYVTVTKPEIRTKVERIEAAPLPGECRTPDAVLQADL